MKKSYLPLVLLSLAIVDILLYVFKPLGENFYVIADILPILNSFLALLLGFYVFKNYGFNNIQGKALFFISLGLAFWFLGETTWGIYEIILGIETPSSSIADVFWLLGYPCLLVGFYFLFKLTIIDYSKKRLFGLAILIIFVFYLTYYLVQPTLTSTEMVWYNKITTAGYIVGDVLLITVLIILILQMSKSKFIKLWLIVLLAFIFTILADIYYNNFIDIYQTGDFIDILWDLSYLLLAYGLFYHRIITKQILKQIKR